MTEDATLDAFGDSAESAATSEASDETAVSDAESTNDTPAPLTPTSSWRPGGECASCGEHAARRWWDGDEHVCGDCVSWNTSGGDA